MQFPKKHITFLSSLLLISFTQAQTFKVSYSAAANEVFSGKVILYLSKDTKSPKDASLGIPKLACYAVSVNNIKPNTAIVFDDKAISFPAKLSEIERGDYYVQAVWDKILGGQSIAHSAGNLYNNSIKVNLNKDVNQNFTLNCDQIVREPEFKETQCVKELKVNSTLLTSFHGKPTSINAAVILPREYTKDPNRKFPVFFEVFGFGGNYHRYSGDTSASKPMDTAACIRVILDGNCPLGHNVYANSDNNGPWGDALIKELIPALEKTYRCNGARFLYGHSSGGWTVVWLQTQYAKTFAGCWSSSPDPLDFRDFSTINLYTDKNMYYTKDSSLRVIASIAGRIPWMYMRDYYQMENVIYRGEQLHSFDAVFGKKGKDGNPQYICDHQTGEIDTTAFSHWKQYDISLLLRTNWEKYKADVDGKIRVSVGKGDNFFLNRPVALLEKEMKKLNANMVFEYYPGDHFTVFSDEYKSKGLQFLAQKYSEWLVKNKK